MKLCLCFVMKYVMTLIIIIIIIVVVNSSMKLTVLLHC